MQTNQLSFFWRILLFSSVTTTGIHILGFRIVNLTLKFQQCLNKLWFYTASNRMFWQEAIELLENSGWRMSCRCEMREMLVEYASGTISPPDRRLLIRGNWSEPIVISDHQQSKIIRHRPPLYLIYETYLIWNSAHLRTSYMRNTSPTFQLKRRLLIM